MLKHIVTAAAVLGLVQGLVVGTAAAAAPYSAQPEGAVYVSLGFGGPTPRTFPLHYGLLMRYDESALPFYRRLDLPPLFRMDFDVSGDGVAMIDGVPFMRHFAKLDQNGSPDGGGSTQTTPGGLTVVDWGLLGLGVAGIGYGISQVVRSKDSPTPPNSNNQPPAGSGGLLGNLLTGGGATSAAQYELGYTGAQNSLLLQGDPALVFDTSGVNRPDPGYTHWLNSGTGRMGDLKSR